MVKEQQQDPELRKLRNTLDNSVTRESVKRRYAIVDGLLYYVNNDEEDDPCMRVLVPDRYKQAMLEQHHDNCAHWGIEKTFGMIRMKYHWIGLYRDIVQHVTQCITCKIRSQKKNKVPLQQMDDPVFPGQKWGLHLCGPYPESAAGSKYILTAVDLYSGWPEIWALPDKRSESIARVILDELIPRFSSPMTFLRDNALEFRSQIFEQMCSSLCIHLVYTSPYRPASNGRTEHFDKVMNDMLSKKTSRHIEQWDQYLPSIVQAYRVGISESTGHSPFFLMYTRDPELPLDNLLQPRHKYLGEEYHKVALECQHEAFMKLRRHLRKTIGQGKRDIMIARLLR